MIKFFKVVKSNFTKVFLSAVCLFPLCSQAIPVFEISPSINSIYLKPGASTISPIEFTVKNNSDIDMPDLTFDANYVPSSLFSASIASGVSGSCLEGSVLKKNTSCILPVSIKAASIFGSATLRPRVCGFYGNICSRGGVSINVTNNIKRKGHFVFEDSSNKPITSLSLAPGETDTITLKNTGGVDISGFNLVIGTMPKGTIINNNTCKTIKVLSKNGSCIFRYSVSAASASPSSGTFDITASGNNATVDNTPYALRVHVASAGHFVFEDSSTTPITSLNLAPGETDTITVKNTGGVDISGFNLLVPSLPKGTTITTNTCTVATLPKNGSCTFTYNVSAASASPSSGTFDITASGNNATVDNTPYALRVHVASAGHFVFEDSSTTPITSLNLAPGETDTITVKNTGGVDISGFNLLVPSLPKGTTITTNTCTVATLPKNGSCTFTYNVSAASASPSSGTFDITASGNNATVDNTPYALRVHVASAGHFVFEDSSTTPITSLNLAPGETDTITVKNTGGVDISGFNLLVPSLPKGTTITTNTCTVATLPKNGSCTFTYNVSAASASPSSGTFDITASGNNATVDNTPYALRVHVASAGHFVFEDSSTTPITSLNLAPGETDTITVKNTGGVDISGFNLLVPSLPKGTTITTNTCTVATLPKNGSCTFTYNVSAASTHPSSGAFDITAKGTGADNSPKELKVEVDLPGHYYIIGGSYSGSIFKVNSDFSRISGSFGLRLNGVAYGDDQYVSVGLDGIILTSIDASTWSLQKSLTSNNLHDILYADNKFVAVGDNGTILTSQDAVTWASQVSGTTEGLYGIAYGNNKFVAVGDNGTILTSQDAVTWASQVSGTTEGLYDITYGHGYYIAVGNNSIILRSSDGGSWSKYKYTKKFHLTLQSVIYDNQQYLAAGTSGKILSSRDGITWNTENTGTDDSITHISYLRGQYIAVTAKGNVLKSTDGKGWTILNIGINSVLTSITYAKNNYVAVGSFGTIFKSNKIEDLKVITIPGNTFFKDVNYISDNGKRKYVAVSGINVFVSNNGAEWANVATILGIFSRSICHGPNEYVAVGSGGELIVSTDAIKWTKRLSYTKGDMSSVIYANGVYIAVGFRGQIVTSQNTIKWNPQASGTRVSLNKITYDNGKFVAVGDNGTILTSQDAVTWTSQVSGTQESLYGIAYGNNKFVAVGDNGTILTSQDAVTWTSQVSGTQESLYGIAYGNNKFVAVGNSNIILMSQDANIWALKNIGMVKPDFNYTNVVYLPDGTVAN